MKKTFIVLIALVFFTINSMQVLAPCSYTPSTGRYDEQGEAGSCAELKIENDHYEELNSNDLKTHMDKVPDLSRVKGEELSKALKEKYGADIKVNNLPAASKIEGDTLKAGGNTLNLKELKGTHTIDFKEGQLIINGNPVQGAQNVMSTADGNGIQISEATSIDFVGAKILNAKNVVIFKDELLADYAQTYIRDSSIATDVKNLKIRREKFAVGEAEKIVSSCNSFDNVKDSEFEVKNDEIKVTASSNVTLNITDCSYRDIEFESKRNGSSVTIKKDSYEISKGSLKCGSRDKIEADSSASIEVGSDCFSCMTIIPAGTYFYSDADIRKDFSVNVPKEAPIYKLCLRKNQAQQLRAYNGLIDFVDREIELNGIVNYLRYPLKDSQISSLLSSFVYRGLKNVNALLSYDKELLFLEKTTIKNTISNKKQVTITKPNNLYSIEEIELDGKVHRVVDLKLIAKEDITQDMLSSYESDSLDADVRIVEGVLVQQAEESKITILPPGHKNISSFLR